VDPTRTAASLPHESSGAQRFEVSSSGVYVSDVMWNKNGTEVGSPGWARTSDFLINSQALYRLSYRGMPARPTRYPQILPQFGVNA
jgi:hypothetical protein